VNVHLVDGTYELFRHFHVVPSTRDEQGVEVGATRGVVGSLLGMLERGVTHVGVATDHEVESFRNELWPGYKTGEGIEPELLAQFPLVEQALEALGVVVWPMVEYEADDALASAAARAARERSVTRVIICTPDKDLSQCVVDDRVLQLDRRANVLRNAAAVREKFGVDPESIPDYLALVGDASDGYPGLPGWGAKSAAAVIGRYGHLEEIPPDAADWDVAVRGAAKRAATLGEYQELAWLFRDLATLRSDLEVLETVESLRWLGPRPNLQPLAARLGAPGLWGRAQALAERRVGAAGG
jgi:5'-3' exonuclease